MKTLLQIEMYYVREYTPTCRFLKIINETRNGNCITTKLAYKKTIKGYGSAATTLGDKVCQ
jgi:hypothetical protein